MESKFNRLTQSVCAESLQCFRDPTLLTTPKSVLPPRERAQKQDIPPSRLQDRAALSHNFRTPAADTFKATSDTFRAASISQSNPRYCDLQSSTLPFTSIYPSQPTYSPYHGPMYSADYTEKSVSCVSETRRPQCVGLIDPGMRRDCPKEVLPERLDLRPSNLKTNERVGMQRPPEPGTFEYHFPRVTRPESYQPVTRPESYPPVSKCEARPLQYDGLPINTCPLPPDPGLGGGRS